jgi:Gpi18-like mannosyltransferase
MNEYKKVLRDPLFYLLPLLVAVFLVLINTKVATEISEVKLTKNDSTRNITFPYLENMKYNEIFSVSFNLAMKDESVKLHIIPDDCIQEILVNGKNFQLDGIKNKNLCDHSGGVHLDFSEYIQDSLNHFEIRIINSGGGLAGLDVKIPYSIFKNLSMIHIVFIFLFLFSFVLGLIRFRNYEIIFKSLLLLAASILFYFIAIYNNNIIPTEISVPMMVIFLGASCFFLPNKQINYTAFIFILTVLIGFMLIRGGLFYFKSGDYNSFLVHWVRQMRGLSYAEAISTKIGDYNMPYLYILALISRFNIADLFLIKLVSTAFDIVLAYYVMKIVSIKFENINVQIAAFFAVLGMPTVILNGAFWAQCDAIYAAMAIASLYYGFTNRSVCSYIFFGLALSIKLQAIFIAPVLIILIFLKKNKIIHIWISIVVLFLTIVPALIAGKPFIETISIYHGQMNSYPQMVLNTPNIYTLLGNVKFSNFNFVAILITGIVVVSLLYFLYLNKEKIISPADYVSTAFVFTLIIPMLLPRMHERYFFLAEVLAVILVFFDKKKWYFAPIIIIGSFMTYSRFLLGINYFISMEHASIIMIFITLIAVKNLVERFTKETLP